MSGVPGGAGQLVALGGRIVNGHKTVTSAGTAERLTTSATRLINGVLIKALSGNNGDVYVGDSSVDSTNGFVLDAGEEIFLRVKDLSLVWIDVGTSAEGVSYIAS